MGCTIPDSCREAASSERRSLSNALRGWSGFGSRSSMGTSAAVSAESAVGSGSGRSADRPLPSAFLFMGHDFLGEVEIGLGPLRPYVVEQYRFTKAGGLGEPDAAGHNGTEQTILEVRLRLRPDLLREVVPL